MRRVEARKGPGEAVPGAAQCFPRRQLAGEGENRSGGAWRKEEAPAGESVGPGRSREGRVAGQRRRRRPVGGEIRRRRRPALFPSRREVEDGLGDLVANTEKFRGLPVN